MIVVLNMFLDDSHDKLGKLDCGYIGRCSGCQIAHLNTKEQVDLKLLNFSKLWKNAFNSEPKIDFIRKHETKFRHRADLTIENNETQKIGFYETDTRQILDIKDCPLMSVELSEIYKKLRRISFNIKKGSVRIRVSPDKQFGLWIDFSNEDIRDLLANTSILDELQNIFDVIEIGQKRKRLSLVEGKYKLTDPQTQNWFETYDSNLVPIPLPMNIGGFSQTGFETNKLLIAELLKTLSEIENIGKQDWLELCSGSGNLTFPLSSLVKSVIATELDRNAVESLTNVAKELRLTSLRVERVNIHKASPPMQDLLLQANGILADPPRSGLQNFSDVLSSIPKNHLPQEFIYVSCFAETLVEDLKKIIPLGYEVMSIKGVDQFPHSLHCEWIVRLRSVRSN